MLLVFGSDGGIGVPFSVVMVPHYLGFASLTNPQVGTSRDQSSGRGAAEDAPFGDLSDISFNIAVG